MLRDSIDIAWGSADVNWSREEWQAFSELLRSFWLLINRLFDSRKAVQFFKVASESRVSRQVKDVKISSTSGNDGTATKAASF